MKIKETRVEGATPGEADRLRGQKKAGATSGERETKAEAVVDTEVKVSLELARELNALATQAFDDDENDPERRKKVEELKKKYKEGKLSYDSTVVAESFLKELFQS